MERESRERNTGVRKRNGKFPGERYTRRTSSNSNEGRQRVNNVQTPQMLQKQRDAALEYWFLLESDPTAALIKGNYGLLELAFNRIDFLKPKVNAKFLEECKKGEEEALCTVKQSLISNGWWDRANRLPMRIQEYSSK